MRFPSSCAVIKKPLCLILAYFRNPPISDSHQEAGLLEESQGLFWVFWDREKDKAKLCPLPKGRGLLFALY
jgi:hypothetical protein